ncbi:MAG: SDR family oxidoreductase, partial [Pseudomonadota bacterium]
VGAPMAKRVGPLAEQIGADIVMDCDVGDPAAVADLMDQVRTTWGGLDFIVHAIGFSDKSELRGKYINTSRENFLTTMDISVYSFTAVLQAAQDVLNPGASCLTLSYFGAEKVMPNYNVMGVAKAGLEASVRYLAEDLGRQGVRVNAISAGTIKTLAASGIGDFRAIMNHNAATSPLRRTVSQDEVGGSALYLLSDLASGVTGEIHHVDAGFHTIGMKSLQDDG